MPKLPVLSGKEFIKFLEFIDFSMIRQKGSHVRLKCSYDERKTSVPIHENKDLPKGLLRKIVREDLELTLDEFIELYKKYKKQ